MSRCCSARVNLATDPTILRAIRNGHEPLDADLMNQVKNDAAAEEARKELEAEIKAGLKTTRPTLDPRRQRKSA
ncbi:hypothetical protein [Streptomyces milbemycinicus]|uniref:hypothetical protein n=1 Tax=Streptomyces milbemycinicus TaxID=476552 RepID=UPI0033D0B649